VLLAVIASTIASSIVAALVHPLRGAITTILYFDLRVRKEAFDLALLAAGLGLPEPDLSAWPAGSPAPSIRTGGGGEAPPFWPPPPGWKPSAPAPAPAPDPAPAFAPVPAEAATDAPGGENPDRPAGEPPPFWPPPPGWSPGARPEPAPE
jgi:hypothetical protein